MMRTLGDSTRVGWVPCWLLPLLCHRAAGVWVQQAAGVLPGAAAHVPAQQQQQQGRRLIWPGLVGQQAGLLEAGVGPLASRQMLAAVGVLLLVGSLLRGQLVPAAAQQQLQL